MIPKKESAEYKIINYPSLTYKLNDNNRIYNNIDGIEAVKQSIYKILNTDRYSYLIYSFNYGFEILDLIGEPYNFVILELENRIKEALLQDDRILKVKDFKFSKDFDLLICSFEVDTVFGNLKTEQKFNL